MAFSHLKNEQLAYWLEMKPGEINIIDIRDKGSFVSDQIKGAIHIDNSNVEGFCNTTNKDQALVVYCYHGNSSQSAANYFAEQGFKDVYSLDGGFEEWKIMPFHTKP